MGTKDPEPKTLKLAPGEQVTVYRDVQIVDGKRTVASGDRMHVQHITGNMEDVFVQNQADKLSVKRVVQHIDFQTGRDSYSLADLPEADEKRLRALNKRVTASGG